MPITLLGGPPRSGKSHYGVKYRLMNFFKKGIVTVTDVAGLSHQAIADYAGVSLEEAQRLVILVSTQEVSKMLKAKTFLYDPVNCPNSFVRPGQHLMMDEAWRYWKKGQKLNDIELEFFPMHGHYNDPISNNPIEITLLSQAKSQLAQELLPLIEAQYIFRKMKAIGRPNEFQIFVYDGNSRKATSSYREKYDPKVFPLYKSADSGEAKDDFDKRRSLFSTGRFKFIMYGLPFLFILGGYLIYSSMSKITSGHALKGTKDNVAAVAGPTGPVGAAPGATPLASTNAGPDGGWRVAASYQAGGISVVVLVDEKGRYRTLTPGAYTAGAGGELYVVVPPATADATSWSGVGATYTPRSGAVAPVN